MQTSKKTLLIMVSVSLYSFVTGMETDPKERPKLFSRDMLIVRSTPENQAKKMACFARDNNNDTDSALAVAEWLVASRKSIVEDEKWTTFMDRFVSKMKSNYCLCFCEQNEKLEAAINGVLQTIYELGQGEDCSQLLVDRIIENLNQVGQ